LKRFIPAVPVGAQAWFDAQVLFDAQVFLYRRVLHQPFMIVVRDGALGLPAESAAARLQAD
jgi:hypothetical protein